MRLAAEFILSESKATWNLEKAFVGNVTLEDLVELFVQLPIVPVDKVQLERLLVAQCLSLL